MSEASVSTVTVPQLPATFEGAFLLDVREHDEWNRGHAPEATHIPLGEVSAKLDQIPRDATLFVVCHLGGRSMRAAEFLAAEGYTPTNITGGMAAWAAAGRRVIDANGRAGSV